VHSFLPVSGGVRSSMPVDGAREAAAFGLCSSFSRLIGQGEGGVQSFQSKGTHAVFISYSTDGTTPSCLDIFLLWLG